MYPSLAPVRLFRKDLRYADRLAARVQETPPAVIINQSGTAAKQQASSRKAYGAYNTISRE